MTNMVEAYYDISDTERKIPYDIEGRILMRCPDCDKRYEEVEKSREKIIEYFKIPKSVFGGSKRVCDHLIGRYQNWDGWDEDLLESEFTEVIVKDRLRDYKGEKARFIWKKIARKNYYCPKKGCGAKINWRKIEKRLVTNS